jgi:hypothetical protein
MVKSMSVQPSPSSLVLKLLKFATPFQRTSAEAIITRETTRRCDATPS